MSTIAGSAAPGTAAAPSSTLQGPDSLAKQYLQPGFLKDKSAVSPVTLSSRDFDIFTGSQIGATVRMANKRDVMSLWSLLEACLQANYNERSLSILKSLYNIESHRRTFIDDYNLYCSHMCASMTSTAKMSKMVQHDLTNVFPGVTMNAKTVAILVHHSIRVAPKGADLADLKSDISIFLSQVPSGPKAICANVDVLTYDDFKVLYRDLGLVKLQQLPSNIRDMLAADEVDATTAAAAGTKSTDSTATLPPADSAEFNSLMNSASKILNSSATTTTTTTEASKVELDKDVETVEKDARQLVNVDTLGMKVIRHTLLGLSLTDEQKGRIANFSFNAGENIFNLDEAKTINFFDMYSSLKTPEERELFEKVLEDFNQDRQQSLEVRATDAAKERWRHDFEEAKARGDIAIKKSLNAKLWNWYSDMLPLMKKEVARCKREMLAAKGPSKKYDYAPYLALVNPEKMCVITILELLKLNSTGGIAEGMRTARAVISVGKSIEMEFRSEQLLKNESYMLKDINKKSNEFKKYIRNAKKSLRSLHLDEAKVIWPQSIRAKVGSVLISLLINVARVPVEGIDPITNQKVYGDAPAFSHSYQYHSGIKLGVIRIHPALTRQLNGDKMIASVQPQLLPMLVKPRPWVSSKSGGYYYSQSNLVRTKDSPEQTAYIDAASKSHAIDQVYDGLNVLGETSWTVNRRMFDVISQVWNTGKPFLEIPGIQQAIQYLPRPPSDADPSVVNKWKEQNKEIANEFASNRSMRCDMNYKLEIARAFLGEKFYFPHNMDFRGRAYPLSPHFNHLGNDMSRSLLTFWKGKRLGKDGLMWLKVHLANLYGVNKVPIEGRVQFVEDHMDDIRNAVENPLESNDQWWLKSDKPWQTLATCYELIEALKLENPEDFISHQPVHQDGTCNGLQHYAALGGDMIGASQVNLIPDVKPNDVYMHVANNVKANLIEKLKTKPDDEIAKFFVENINRKIVKQTVMTHVYGVTLVGATLQIDKQIHAMIGDKKKSLAYANYLAKEVFAAIRQSFNSAHLIQDWLGECCTRVSKSIRLDIDKKSLEKNNKPDFMTSVIWTTPLGLPIVQPYREVSKKQVDTNLQTVFISDPFAVNQINARRQKAGFPPNFIHSLDASHMLMSASKCYKDGLEFASVHDSYWTHAADIPTMNKNLREQFVALHEVDLIERLKNEFDERYQNYVKVMKIPTDSEMGIKISKLRQELTEQLGRPVNFADEIEAEQQRLALLQSTQEEDVERGKQMVTTISLAENADEIFTNEEKKGDSGRMVIFTRLVLPEIPSKGDFDVASVKDSTYFFS